MRDRARIFCRRRFVLLISHCNERMQCRNVGMARLVPIAPMVNATAQGVLAVVNNVVPCILALSAPMVIMRNARVSEKVYRRNTVVALLYGV